MATAEAKRLETEADKLKKRFFTLRSTIVKPAEKKWRQKRDDLSTECSTEINKKKDQIKQLQNDVLTLEAKYSHEQQAVFNEFSKELHLGDDLTLAEDVINMYTVAEKNADKLFVYDIHKETGEETYKALNILFGGGIPVEGFFYFRARDVYGFPPSVWQGTEWDPYIDHYDVQDNNYHIFQPSNFILSHFYIPHGFTLYDTNNNTLHQIRENLPTYSEINAAILDGTIEPQPDDDIDDQGRIWTVKWHIPVFLLTVGACWEKEPIIDKE